MVDKANLRRTLRLRRRRLEDRAARSRAIVDHLRASETWGRASVVAAFVALPEEVDLAVLLAEAGRTVVLPRVVARGERLVFHAAPADVRGGLGVWEPRADSPVVPLSQVDLILVPAVGVDRYGRRLGMGGGYYDRTLAACPQVRRVAPIFACQVVSAVPVEVTDERVHAFVTENGWVDVPELAHG